jgi:hypothetical protein
MMMALDADGQHHVVGRDRAHRAVEDVDLDLVGALAVERLAENLDRTLHVGLDDDVELLGLGPSAMDSNRFSSDTLRFAI